MEDWWRSHAATLDRVWSLLGRGVADRRAAARHPVLATVGLRGYPEARTVVLRAASRADARLEVHTDSASAKVGELAETPRASLHVWDPQCRLQIRLRVCVTIRTGDAVAETWARVPEEARAVYGGVPEPGRPVDRPEDPVNEPDSARFAVLDCRAAEIETLHLGRDLHRRAIFAAADGWRGRWLTP